MWGKFLKTFKNVTKTLMSMSLGFIEGPLRACNFITSDAASLQPADRVFSLCTVLSVIEKQKSNVANDARYHSKLFRYTFC